VLSSSAASVFRLQQAFLGVRLGPLVAVQQVKLDLGVRLILVLIQRAREQVHAS
jgi:hypothetical protein